MRRTRMILAATVCVFCILPAVAQAHRHHHCRKGYAWTTKRERVHGHARRVSKCRKVHANRPSAVPVVPPALPVAPAPAAPAAPGPGPTRTRLHSHLDPTYTQDPSNPFRVTYAYSASATAEVESAAHVESAVAPAELPAGVLALYNDGVLACAINVGGGTQGGECPVTYAALGQHTVTTLYASGELTSTETSTETIEPFRAATPLSVTYTALEQSKPEGEAACHWGGESAPDCPRYIVGHVIAESAPGTRIDLNAPWCAPGVCHATTEEPGPLDYVVWVACKPGTTEVVEFGLGSAKDKLPTGSNWVWYDSNPLSPSKLAEGAYGVTALTDPTPGYEWTPGAAVLSLAPEVK